MNTLRTPVNHLAIARHAVPLRAALSHSHNRFRFIHIKAPIPESIRYLPPSASLLPSHRIPSASKMSTSSTSPAIAGPISDCCAQGVKHTGDAVGRVETIAGVETYISDPPAGAPGPKKVILYFADIFSPLFINAKLLQDYFAAQGVYFAV
jgi:hypothetical protein